MTSVAQWVGHRPTKQGVAGSIPGEGTCLGCRFSPWLGRFLAHTKRQPIDVSLSSQCFSPSLSPFLPLPLSPLSFHLSLKSNEKMSLGKEKNKMELYYVPGIPLLGIYLKKPETLDQKNVCTPMFFAALFTIAKVWKQPSAHQ